MRIEVLHNISPDASFGLNMMFDKDGKFREPGSHELVKVFEFDGSTGRPPDDVYRMLNVGHEPGFAHNEYEHRVALQYRARRLRSLSVGDVLIFGHAIRTCIACESSGWSEVHREDLRVLSTRAALLRVRERYEYSQYEELAISVPWDQP